MKYLGWKNALEKRRITYSLYNEGQQSVFDDWTEDRDRLIEALEKSRGALQGAKMLTQGPSFERQDAIMCHILEAIMAADTAIEEIP